jgi:hypothetical protein
MIAALLGSVANFAPSTGAISNMDTSGIIGDVGNNGLKRTQLAH